MLVFNRMYLLSGLFISFTLPLLENPIYSLFISNGTNPIGFISQLEYAFLENPESNSPIQLSTFRNVPFIVSYFTITALLLIRFIYQVGKLLVVAITSEKVKEEDAILVLRTDEIAPYTFWKYIYINSKTYTENAIPKEVITHESTHTKQLHTLDILLIELLKVFLWFNPIIHLYKRAIQLNHELLADEGVVRECHDVNYYQHLLLNSSSPNENAILTSSFNYFITKNRLKMMNKQTTQLKKFSLIALSLPLLLGVMLLFSTSSEAQNSNVNKESQKINASYFKEVMFTFKSKDGKEIFCDYDHLSDKRKQSLPPPPPKLNGENHNPLPKGTLVTLTDDGKVIIGKGGNKIPPPPPPPKSPKTPLKKG